MWKLLWTASGRPGFGGSASLGGSVDVKLKCNLTHFNFKSGRLKKKKLAG